MTTHGETGRDAASSEGTVTVTETRAGGYTQQIIAGRHRLVADEPRPIGDDAGPTPYDLLLGGLGACTSMTVRMYADRKRWPLERIR
jgi:putative redox protein